MAITVSDIDVSTDAFLELLASKVVDKLMPIVDKKIDEKTKNDEFLTAQQLANEVFHCSAEMVTNFYLYQPGFPVNHKGSQKVFSRKAVERWMLNSSQPV